MDALALEGVGGTGLQVELVDHEGEVLLEGLVDRRGADLDALGLDIELTGQAEELHERLAGGGQGVTRGDGGLGLDVDDETVEVGALLHTGGLDGVGDLLDRRVDRVHRDAGDLRVGVLVLVGGDVAAAALDRQLDLQLALLVESGDDQVGVVDLDAGRRGDVTGGDLARTGLAQVHDDRLVVLRGQDDLLDVEDDLGDILLDPGDRAELVGHPVDADAGHGRPRDGGQQRAAQGVAECVAEAGLEGLEHEARAAVLDHDLLGERGSLCNEHVVSFRRGARYMTPFLMGGAAGPPGPVLLRAPPVGRDVVRRRRSTGCAVVP